MQQKILSYILIFFVFLPQVFSQRNTQKFTVEQNDSIIERVYHIDEITVEQSRSSRLSGISSGKIILHTEGIKSVPTMMGTTDVLKVLELTPGVQTSGEGKSNIYVRGGDPGQTLLLYNNIPVYTPGHVLNIFPLFNADHLASVELVKGGVDATYGNFISGVILSKPKEYLPEKSGVKGNVGILASQVTLDLSLGNKFGAYISGRKTYLNLLLKPLTNATLNRNIRDRIEDMGYDFQDLNATFIGQFSEKNKLVVDAFLGSDELKIAERDLVVRGSIDWSNYALSAKFYSDLTKGKKLEQQLVYSKFRNKLGASLSEYALDLHSSIFNAGYNNKISYDAAGIPFESGMQYTFYQLSPQETEIQNMDVSTVDVSFGKNQAHNLALFTTARIQPLPRLQLEPGIRYNLFYSHLLKTGSTKTFHHVDFRFFGKYQLNDQQLLRGTFSHNVQYINKLFPSNTGLPTDFWIAASAESLPQYASEFSVGYYHVFSDGMFEFSSDIYFRRMYNLIEYNQNFLESEQTVFTERIKTGDGRAYGIELMFKKNFGKFSGWLSYSLGRSERWFSEIDNGDLFPAAHDRTHDLSFTGAYILSEKWDVSLVQVFATGNAFTAPSSWYFINNTPVAEYGKHNDARMTNYMRTDFSINYWFKKENGINLSVYNMFAIRNPLYISLSLDSTERQNQVAVRMKKRVLFTIMPSISWKFKF